MLLTLAAIVTLALGVWGINLVQLRRSVASSADYWAVPRGETGGLVYVALGDSAAQGIGASRPEAGYVSLVAAYLGEATRQPVRVINLSTSGARLRDVVSDQVPQLAGLCADVITVGVGGNDIRNYDADEFARDIAALTAGLPRGTVIADLPYFMHGQWQTDVEEGNALLLSDARADGLVVAGLQQAMRQRGWQGMFTDYAADWFHPDDDGHRVWASVFIDALQPRIATLRPTC